MSVLSGIAFGYSSDSIKTIIRYLPADYNFSFSADHNFSDVRDITPLIFFLIALALFSIFTIYQGFLAGFSAVMLILVVSVAVSVVSQVRGTILGAELFLVNILIELGVLGAGSIVGVLSILIATLALGVRLAIFMLAFVLLVALTVAGMLVEVSVSLLEGVDISDTPRAVGWMTALAIVMITLNTFVAWRALAGDEKHDFVRIFAVAFAAIGGTSFRGADLTDADFTNATLKSTDFRGATLTRTCWRNAHKLDRARVGDSILTKKAVRELLITGKGYEKNYLGANLRGAHLVGAILNKAVLKEAEISEANLQGAELEWAILTKVQAVGTDFTGAKLTGACLEAWNIDSTTKLEEVDCQYVFLLEKEDNKGSRERRPHDHDTIFQPGDFAKLYKEVMNTVQILLRNAGNKVAFNIALQELMEKNPEITPDSIQGIQKKGEDVLLTLQVPEGTDKDKIERDFLEPYTISLKIWYI